MIVDGWKLLVAALLGAVITLAVFNGNTQIRLDRLEAAVTALEAR